MFIIYAELVGDHQHRRSSRQLTVAISQGLAHANCQGLLDFRTFDLEDYDFHERVENGDSTWILPGDMSG